MGKFVKGKECRFMRDFSKYILYEDSDLIICHKPSGFPVQSARTRVMDLEYACLNYLHTKEEKKQPFVGIVQRLDQPVEGVMVLAKNQKTAGELGKQVQDGRMKKEYLAVAEGRVEPVEGELEDWLIKDSRLRMGKVVSSNTKGAKKARLCYRVLEYCKGRSLLEIQLFTGRYHQIRVQLSHRGWPLAGDRKYNGMWKEEDSLGLCAYRLCLIHPVSKKEMSWEIRPGGNAFNGWNV